jgi:hypothetical protein
VRAALPLALSTALVLALAPPAEGASANRPRVALSVSPAKLALTAPGSRSINLRNDGAERVVVDVARRAVGRQTASQAWFKIVPARLILRSGERAILTLRVRPPRRAEPGEHHVLVLLTTRPLRGSRVTLRVRLGIRVRMRVPGRVVRHLALGGLRVHRAARGARLMFVSVANHGNVTVQLRGHVTASLFRRRQRVARLNPAGRRALAPGARTLLALRYAGRVRGPVTAVVQVRLGHGVRVVERRYRIRL